MFLQNIYLAKEKRYKTANLIFSDSALSGALHGSAFRAVRCVVCTVRPFCNVPRTGVPDEPKFRICVVC